MLVYLDRFESFAIIIAVVILGAGAAVANFIGVFSTGPKAPNVKFVDFKPDAAQTITPTKPLSITFRVHNFEQSIISNATIVTAFSGDQKFFEIDKPNLMITPALDMGNGESGTRTIIISGKNLSDQNGIDSVITVKLYVSKVPSHIKSIPVHLKPD